MWLSVDGFGRQNVRAVPAIGERQARRLRLQHLPPAVGANIIATVDRVRAATAPACAASMPPSGNLDVTIVLDRTTTIRASVRRRGADAGDRHRRVVILYVVFVFLRSVRRHGRSPAVAVPVSLVGTCAVMYLVGLLASTTFR